MTLEELKQKGFELFAAREQAQQQIVKINQDLQNIFNQIGKLEAEKDKENGERD